MFFLLFIFHIYIYIYIYINLSWFFFLINRYYLYKWVAVVFWLNNLILDVDLQGSFIQHQMKLLTRFWIHPPCCTFTILHPIISYIIYSYGLYDTFLPQNLLSSNKQEQEKWVNVEVAININDCKKQVWYYSGDIWKTYTEER